MMEVTKLLALSQDYFNLLGKTTQKVNAIHVLENFYLNGLEAGYGEQILKDIQYIYTALLDEKNRGGVAESESLQWELFQERYAGEVFFIKLEYYKKTPNKYHAIIFIFYICLLLGFKGQYSLIGENERRELIYSLRKTLTPYYPANNMTYKNTLTKSHFNQWLYQLKLEKILLILLSSLTIIYTITQIVLFIMSRVAL